MLFVMSRGFTRIYFSPVVVILIVREREFTERLQVEEITVSVIDYLAFVLSRCVTNLERKVDGRTKSIVDINRRKDFTYEICNFFELPVHTYLI